MNWLNIILKLFILIKRWPRTDNHYDTHYDIKWIKIKSTIRLGKAAQLNRMFILECSLQNVPKDKRPSSPVSLQYRTQLYIKPQTEDTPVIIFEWTCHSASKVRPWSEMAIWLYLWSPSNDITLTWDFFLLECNEDLAALMIWTLC